MPDLLLCPHCGSSAAFHQLAEPDSDNDGGYYIECANPLCGMTTTLMFACGDDPKPLLAERWNRRVTPASDDGVSRLVAMLRSHPPKLMTKALEASGNFSGRLMGTRAILDAIASYIEEHARPAPSDDTPTRDELIEALEKANSVLDRTAIGENTMKLRDDAFFACADVSSVLARIRRG